MEKEILNQFTDLVKDIGIDYKINQKSMENLGKQIAKILAWKLAAKTEEEKKQADIALEILTREMPVTIRAMVSEEQMANTVAKIIGFGIKVAKILL